MNNSLHSRLSLSQAILRRLYLGLSATFRLLMRKRWVRSSQLFVTVVRFVLSFTEGALGHIQRYCRWWNGRDAGVGRASVTSIRKVSNIFVLVARYWQ